MKSEKLNAAVKNHIIHNMTKQVVREFEERTFVAGDITEATNRTDSEGEDITVYEWWLVSDDFSYAAKKVGEIVVDTPFGTIWGRQTTGQRVSQDLNVRDILKTIDEI